MAKREVDLSFGPREKLWRRLEVGEFDKATNGIKPHKLRLQISVVRERHGSREQVPEEKWNGVAEAHAADLFEASGQHVKVACVDEPLQDRPGHALIALFLKPGDPLPESEDNAVRAKLGGLLQVIVPPHAV